MSFNHVTVMGRLGRPPELRHTQSGVSVATFTLACDRDYRDKNTGQKETDRLDIVCWRGTADFAERYLDRGRMVVVDGRLQCREWTDKEGKHRKSTEIVADNIYFADSKRDGGGDTSNTIREDEIPEQRQEFTGEDDDGGELPF